MKSLIAIGLLALSSSAMAALIPTEFRCENLVMPRGIQNPTPRLSWALRSDARGDKQTAYQIRVASTLSGARKTQADLWDSGKVASGETLHIPYAGKPLKSGQECWW